MQRSCELAANNEFVCPNHLRLLRLKVRHANPASISDPQLVDGSDAHAMRRNVENLDDRPYVALAELDGHLKRTPLGKARNPALPSVP
jgi:hypothetical protein